MVKNLLTNDLDPSIKFQFFLKAVVRNKLALSHSPDPKMESGQVT